MFVVYCVSVLNHVCQLASRNNGGIFVATELSGSIPYPTMLCGPKNTFDGGELLKYVCGSSGLQCISCKEWLSTTTLTHSGIFIFISTHS